MGNVRVVFLAASTASFPVVTMSSTLRPTSSAASARKLIKFAVSVSVLDQDVLPLNITKLTKPVSEIIKSTPLSGSRRGHEHPDPRDLLRLLRVGDHDNSQQHHCNQA